MLKMKSFYVHLDIVLLFLQITRWYSPQVNSQVKQKHKTECTLRA